MKLIATNRERTWYLVKEWVTAAGLKAHICQCVWSSKFKTIAPSLHDHYTGYVEVPAGDTHNYYDDQIIQVHGGVTFCNQVMGPVCQPGKYAGFDLAHLGDENIPNALEYATTECERLAQQIAARNAAKALRAIPSKKRSAASRKNGKKGGRPKKKSNGSEKV
jgi:hypothetical protein